MDPQPAPSVRQGVLLFLALLLLLGSPRPRPARAESEGVRVEARDLEGGRIEGRLRDLAGNEVTLQTADGERSIPLGSLVRLDVLEGADEPPLGGRILRAHLVGGERIQGLFLKPSPDGLMLSTAYAGPVTIRFDALRSLAVIPPGALACDEPEARYAPSAGDDVAYARSGDATTGILLRTEPEGLVLETGQGTERTIPWDELAVLHLENDALESSDDAVVEVETVSRDRLLAAGPPSLDGDDLVLALRSDPEVTVRIPLKRTRRIRAFGQTLVFASDLPFESSFETPYPTTGDDPTRGFLAAWYGARPNRRPGGCPLLLKGVAYEHGFAVHARSRVVLDLARSFRTFQSLVGVDDLALAETGGGIVDARVLADGKVLWHAEDLRAGDAPRAVGPLDVSDVAQLVLEVDFGRDGLHVRDYATWADPILVRK